MNAIWRVLILATFLVGCQKGARPNQEVQIADKGIDFSDTIRFVKECAQAAETSGFDRATLKSQPRILRSVAKLFNSLVKGENEELRDSHIVRKAKFSKLSNGWIIFSICYGLSGDPDANAFYIGYLNSDLQAKVILSPFRLCVASDSITSIEVKGLKEVKLIVNEDRACTLDYNEGWRLSFNVRPDTIYKSEERVSTK